MIEEYQQSMELLTPLKPQIENLKELIKKAKRLVFVGNGGSFQGHMAHDYLKVGKIPTLAPESPSLLTCLFNDYGTSKAYLEWYDVAGLHGDLLIIVSSSGNSDNVYNLAVDNLNLAGINIVTITGFDINNKLNTLHGMNISHIHIPTDSYGIHELLSNIILHSVLDDIIRKK